MAASKMYVTPAGSGAKTGADWANAFGETEFFSDMVSGAEPGDIYYIKGGTYALSNYTNSALDGFANQPISIIGVKSTTTNEPPVQSDWASLDDRPLIDCGIYYLAVDNYWNIFNLRAVGTGAGGYIFRGDQGSVFFNVSAVSTSVTSNQMAIYLGGIGAKAIGCEAKSTNGIAIVLNAGCMALNCYLHDSSIGFRMDAYGPQITFCIIDTCDTGIEIGPQGGCVAMCNTIYAATTGINASNSSGHMVWNNSITDCTTGMKFDNSGVLPQPVFLNYNNWYNNTMDISLDGGSTEDNSVKGQGSMAANPNYINPAASNFSWPHGSPLEDAGVSITMGI